MTHDCRMLSKRYGRCHDCVWVFIGAWNLINATSRQKLLERLPTCARTPVRFNNMVYGCSSLFLSIFANSSCTLQSAGGSKQASPASMLIFSLTIEPLLQSISRGSRTTLSRWRASLRMMKCEQGKETGRKFRKWNRETASSTLGRYRASFGALGR